MEARVAIEAGSAAGGRPAALAEPAAPAGGPLVDEALPAARWITPACAAWLTGLIVAIGFLVNAAPWIASPLGDSHDGRNAAVWASSGRALRTEPIGSHLGGVNLAGNPYATHPPVIVAGAAATTGLTGDRPLGVRLPAILASLAALAVVSAVLVQMRFGPLAVAAGIALAGTSAMFLTYGTMLDTPEIGLPASAAVLLVAARLQRRSRTPLWAFALVGALCGLTSWQAGLTAGLAGALLLIEPGTRRERIRPVALLAAGLAVAVALTFGWAWWAYGDLATLKEAFGDRTSSTSGWWIQQRYYVGNGYGALRLLVVAAAIVVALVRRRHRLVLAAAVGTPVVWNLLFREGATIHDYWTYSGILAVAVGSAIVVEAVIDRVQRDAPRLEKVFTGFIAAVVAVAALASWAESSVPELSLRSGLDAGRLATELPPASSDDEIVAYLPERFGNPVGWAAWESGGLAASMLSDADLAELARTDPDAPVMIDTAETEVTPAIDAATIATEGDFRLVRAEAFSEA